MREPELRHLRYFVAVAEELHFGRAAARLGMAQPPLSQQIRQLEEMIGRPLLERRPAVRLTSAGEAFLDLARTALRQMREGVEAVRTAQEGDFGVLTVGLASSTLAGPAPEIIRAYREAHPNVAVTLLEMSTAEQAEALRSGRIDVGFMREPEPDPKLTCDVRLEEPFVVAVRRDRQLGPNGSVRARDLADQPFVLFPRNVAPRLHDQVRAICAAAGFQPQVVQEAREWLTILGLVEAGAGITFAPAGFRRLKWGELEYLDLSEPRVTTVVALCRPSPSTSRQASHFIEVAQRISAAAISKTYRR